MALPVTITGISTAVASVGPFKRSAGGLGSAFITLSSARSSNSGFGFVGAALGYTQTFTTTGAVTSVGSVSFYLFRNGSGPDNVYVDIFADDGSGAPTGAALATSLPIAGSSISDVSAQLKEFTFATSVAVSPSTRYVALVRRTNLGADGFDAYYIYNASSNLSSAETGGQQNSGGSYSPYGGTDFDIIVKSALTAAYYFFGRDGTTATTLRAYTATDPTSAWASIATKTGFTTAIQFISSYQVGNVIHMVITDGSGTSINHKYQTFDMSSDTFVTAETINSALNTQTSASANSYMTSIVVRSTAEVVVHYSAARISTFSQTAYRRRTGVATWAAGVAVSATGVNTFSPMVVLGASDRLHFLWYNSTNTQQRHLTSANVLGTAASTGAGLLQDIATFIDAGPTVRFVGVGASHAARWSSADNPTVTTVGVATGQPVRIGDTGGVFYALYRGSADSDLYITTSPDNGATWTTGINVFTGTVALADANLSANQLFYTRGTATVFPYIVNDGGTLKYNEYSILPPTKAPAPFQQSRMIWYRKRFR